MPTLTQDDLAALAAELAQIAERVNFLTQRADTVKAEIREGVPGPDTYQAGDLTILVGTVRRLNQARALVNVPDDLRASCVEVVERVNGERLKILSPEAYEASVVEYPHSVSVR